MTKSFVSFGYRTKRIWMKGVGKLNGVTRSFGLSIVRNFYRRTRLWNSSNNTFIHSFIRDTIEKEFFYYAMVKQREYERYEWFGQINAEWVLIDRRHYSPCEWNTMNRRLTPMRGFSKKAHPTIYLLFRHGCIVLSVEIASFTIAFLERLASRILLA